MAALGAAGKANSQLSQIAVSAKSYGALGNGVANDTAAIQAAINSGAGHVLIPDGTYLIQAVSTSGVNHQPNGGLSLPSNFKLELAPGAILQAIGNSSVTSSVIRITEVDNVIVTGGKIIGEIATHTGSTGEWGFGICLMGASNVTIEDISISACWGDGIILIPGIADTTKPCTNIKLKGVTSDANRRQGMSVCHADGVYATKCDFTNTDGTAPQNGVDIEPEATWYAKNIHLYGCNCSGNTGYGIATNGNLGAVSQCSVIACQVSDNGVCGIQLYKTTNSILSNNIVEGHTNFAGIKLVIVSDTTVAGNVCKSNETGITLVAGAVKNNISGNLCSANSLYGIFLNAATDNVVNNNVCNDNISMGISLYGALNNTINGNNCNGNLCGIKLLSASDYNQISNNYAKNNLESGILLATGNHNLIIGNTAMGNSQKTNATYNNIDLYASSYNTIQNNIVRAGLDANKAFVGINITNVASISNLISNNDCYLGGTAAGIYDAGATTLMGAGNRNKDGSFSTTEN